MRIKVYYCALSNGYFFSVEYGLFTFGDENRLPISVCGIVGMIITRDISTGVQNTAEIIIIIETR